MRLLTILVSLLTVPMALRAQTPVPDQPQEVKPKPKIDPDILARQRLYLALNVHLQDLQGNDEAKREKAVKALIEMGTPESYGALENLQRSEREEVKVAATNVRAQMETRTRELLMEVNKLESDLRSGPFEEQKTILTIETLQKAADYIPSMPMQRSMKKRIENYKNELVEFKRAANARDSLTEKLAADPPPVGEARVKLLLEKSDREVALRNYAAAKADLEEALKLVPDQKELQSQIHLKLANVFNRLNETATALELCRKIVDSYAGLPEVREAYLLQLQILEDPETFDAYLETAIAIGKAYKDDDAILKRQVEAMEVLLIDYLDYIRGAKLAGHLFDALPDNRLKPEIPKYLALCAEYVLKDYPKAKFAYNRILKTYPEAEDLDAVKHSLERLEKKIAGTWPKAPSEKDPEPIATFARFLEKARNTDFEGLASLSAEGRDIDDWEFDLDEEMASMMVFCDFEIEKVTMGPEENMKTIHFKHYFPDEVEPVKRLVRAIREEEIWKIRWPEDVESWEKDAADAFVEPTNK